MSVPDWWGFLPWNRGQEGVLFTPTCPWFREENGTWAHDAAIRDAKVLEAKGISPYSPAFCRWWHEKKR